MFLRDVAEMVAWRRYKYTLPVLAPTRRLDHVGDLLLNRRIFHSNDAHARWRLQ
jgi:hypothetical protein